MPQFQLVGEWTLRPLLFLTPVRARRARRSAVLCVRNVIGSFVSLFQRFRHLPRSSRNSFAYPTCSGHTYLPPLLCVCFLSDVSSVRVVPCFQSKHSGSLPSRSCAVPQGAGHFRVSPFGCRIEDFNHRFRHLVREDISSENPRLEHAVLLPDVVCGRHSVPVSKRIPLIS